MMGGRGGGGAQVTMSNSEVSQAEATSRRHLATSAASMDCVAATAPRQRDTLVSSRARHTCSSCGPHPQPLAAASHAAGITDWQSCKLPYAIFQ